MEYRLTAIPNYYEGVRQETITVSNGANTADFRAFQEVGEAPAQDTPKVSPNSLYFNAEGGIQYLSINIPNTWVITEGLDWITLNMNNGDGNSIVGVTAAANDGNTRSGIIKVRDVVSGIEYDVYVTQVGATSTRSFTINPNHIDVPKEGGTYSVTVNYEGRNGDYVSLNGSGFTWTDLKWEGDTATLTVTVGANTTTQMKDLVLTFTTAIGSFDLTMKQYPSAENVTLEKPIVNFDDGGGEDISSFESNVPWIATVSDTWITVNPTEGEEGYYSLKIVTDPNPSIEPRTGYVWINSKGTGERLATITVNQSGLVEVLTVNPSTITFDAEGGTATFTVNSNTSWNITLME